MSDQAHKWARAWLVARVHADPDALFVESLARVIRQREAELRKPLVEALRESRNALDSLWAAVGDRLLAKGPLSLEYGQSVSRQIREARDRAERALAEAEDRK